MRSLSPQILSVALVASIAGCATSPERIDAFMTPAGQAHPALLKPAAYLIVDSIDGIQRRVNPSGGLSVSEYEIALSPGIHKMIASYEDGMLHSKAPATVTFTVESDHRYLLQIGKTGRFDPEVIDMTARPPACWTVFVNIPMRKPAGC